MKNAKKRLALLMTLSLLLTATGLSEARPGADAAEEPEAALPASEIRAEVGEDAAAEGEAGIPEESAAEPAAPLPELPPEAFAAEAAEEVEEVAVLAVHVEREVDEAGRLLLRAVVGGQPAEEPAFRWQALDPASYAEALTAGGLEAAAALWRDIPDATEDTLIPALYFADACAAYNYRAVVTVGSDTLYSESCSADADEAADAGASSDAEALGPQPVTVGNIALSESRILAHANKLVGTSYRRGYCLEWLATKFWQALGAPYASACCAWAFGNSRIASTSRSDIPVGANIFFSGGGTYDRYGHNCGHVGVWVGNGQVLSLVHYTSDPADKSYVRKNTLAQWESWGYKYRGWGYPDGVTLSGGASVTNLTLNKTAVALDYSQSATLTASVTPAGSAVSWSTSNGNVARISSTGGGSIYVWAINTGTATITCTSGGKKASCTVTVHAPNTLQLTGVDYPSTYIINATGYNLAYGTLASDVDLKSLTSVIKSASGSTVGSSYTCNFGSGVRRYDIKGIDSHVPFSGIRSEGSYTWTLTGTDTRGRTVTMNLKFTAKKAGKRVITGAWGVYAPIPVSGITLDRTAVTLDKSKGETVTLKPTIQPSNAGNKNVLWSSDTPTVATVSGGKVTPVGAGKAIITCTAADGSGVKATCAVTVVGDPPRIPEVTGLTAAPNPAQVGESVAVAIETSADASFLKFVMDGEEQLFPAGTPGDAEAGDGRHWELRCCFAEAGVHELRASASVDGEQYGAERTLRVTVEEADIPVESIELDISALRLEAGKTRTLTATIWPEEATNREVEWSSDDEAIALVDPYGTVEALEEGTTVIRCRALDGSDASAACRLTVVGEEVALRSVRFEEEEISLTRGETCSVGVVTDPAEAYGIFGQGVQMRGMRIIYSNVIDCFWNAEDAVLEITAEEEGSARVDLELDLETADGEGVKLTLYVDVTPPRKPKEVRIRADSKKLSVGDSLQLQAVFRPADSWSEVQWTSSNKKIATVDADGRVHGKKKGTVTITARAKNGGKKATITIKVVK